MVKKYGYWGVRLSELIINSYLGKNVRSKCLDIFGNQFSIGLESKGPKVVPDDLMVEYDED